MLCRGAVARSRRLCRRRAMMPCAGLATAPRSAADGRVAATRFACAGRDARCKMLVDPSRGAHPMLFLLTSRTRPGLGADQYGQLAALAKSFYASIPADVTIRGEWAAVDRS